MKKVIWTVLESPIVLRPALRFFAWLHTMSYFIVSRLSVAAGAGLHPKHRIINYERWFLGKLSAEDAVMDIGSHEGVLVRHLAVKAASVVGVEINRKSHTRSLQVKNPANVRFLCGDATAINLSSVGAVSVVTLSNVLEHIEHRTDFLRKLLTNVHWKGAPRFLIRVPTRENSWITVYKRDIGVEWRTDKTHFTEHTMAELLQEISDAGLRVIDTHHAFGEIFVECVTA